MITRQQYLLASSQAYDMRVLKDQIPCNFEKPTVWKLEHELELIGWLMQLKVTTSALDDSLPEVSWPQSCTDSFIRY